MMDESGGEQPFDFKPRKPSGLMNSGVAGADFETKDMLRYLIDTSKMQQRQIKMILRKTNKIKATPTLRKK